MDNWRVLDADPTVGDATRMLPDFLAKLAEPLSRERRAFWEKMRGTEEVAARQRAVRAWFLAALGDFPERTALNPQVLGRLEYGDYALEKLIYESRPRYFVPANLYLPRHLPSPFPAVLVSCGHVVNGKADPDYQRTCIGLARKGCLVMIVDPMGEGERQDYFDPAVGKSMLGGPVMEHHYAGDPGYLLGLPFPHHRVWDKIRALDFLYARPDVDRSRVACVGHSGGGAMAVLMAAADERIGLVVASAPGGSCEWTLLPGGLNTEESLADLLTVFAPRPLLIYYGEEEPGWKMAQRLEPLLGRVYAALGAADRFRVATTPGGHDHDRPKREQLYGWIDRWFLGGAQGSDEPEIEPQPEAVVQCTPTGQVLSSPGGRALWMVHRDLAREIRPPRTAPASAAEALACREAIVALIRRRAFGPTAPRTVVPMAASGPPVHQGVGASRPEPASGPPDALDVRVFDATPLADGRVVVESLAYTAEEGIRIPALLYVPTGDGGPETGRPADPDPSPAPCPRSPLRRQYAALVYVHESGKSAEAGAGGLFEHLARRGHVVLAMDVRGVGETALPGAPYGDGSGLTAHGSLFGHDAVHAVRALALGRPLFGMRVRDALRAAECLRARGGIDPGRIFIAGRGMGALIALYTAALDESLAGAFCEEGLQSYESVVAHREYAHFMNVFLPGVLRDYDLRDVAACVAPRRLMLLNVVDQARRGLEEGAVEAEYAWTREVYAALGAADRLVVRSIVPQHEAWRRELYRWWLQ